MNNLVSVVIPCYNQAEYLGQAIESVFAQTHKEFEIIVVDDGSTDNTREIAGRYSYVSYFHQKNQGQGVARNYGIRQSKGEFIVFLDADDRLLPNALQIGVQKLIEKPECAFVYGKCRIISDDGSPLPPWPQPLFCQDHYLQLLKDNYIFTTARVLHRRSIVERVGGFSRNVAEDYDLYLRITRIFPVWGHDEVIAEYRQHGKQTSTNMEVMLKATITVLRAQKKNVRGKKEYEEAYQAGKRYWQEKYAGPLIYQLRAYARKPRRWNRAIALMRTLIRYSPELIATRAIRRIRA